MATAPEPGAAALEFGLSKDPNTETPTAPPPTEASAGLSPAAAPRAVLDLRECLQRDREHAADLGNKQDGLPVRFRDLAVYGRGTGDILAPTLPVALAQGLSAPLRVPWDLWGSLRAGARGRKKGKATAYSHEKAVLSGLSGVVHQGECLLVLGRPSSGVTTLLRVLAGDREGFSHVSGHIDYGSLDAGRFPPELKGELALVPEHDAHFATVSVEGNLRLSALCKAPRRRPGAISRSAWASRQVHAWAAVLGLGGALQTATGSELVRGVSGGERKRVGVLEALVGRPSVLCLDNATSGLDSFTALALVDALRTWASIGKRSVIAGLRQTGEPVYERFDKVLLLYEGQEVYFGPSKDARAYFEGLGFQAVPGQTTADFLCACTDPSARRLAPRSAQAASPPPPCTAAEFKRAFRSSDHLRRLRAELEAYEARYPPSGAASHVTLSLRSEKDCGVHKSQPWTVNYLRQVYYLTQRQYAMIQADLRPFLTKAIVNILLSIIVGTLFFQLPTSTAAAFPRGSILLLSLLFNGYLQLSELGSTLANRGVVKRHGSAGFYGPGALAIARTLGDVPLILCQVAVFGGLVYSLSGLQASWGHFGVYLVIVYATALNMTTVFRMFAAFSPSFDEAMRYCGIALNIFVVYAGYFIPTPSMRPFLRWIRYYIDPISYAYEAVLANEFHGLDLACSPEDIVPRGPSYTNSRYQTCALPGSTPGSLTVSGDAYLAVSYDFHYSNIPRNLGVIVLLSLVFLVVGTTATEFLAFAPSGRVGIFKRSREAQRRIKKLSRPRDVEAQARDAADGTAANGHSTQCAPHRAQTVHLDEVATLTWKDLQLWVDTPTETRQLLQGITGFIKPFQCTALMGASGAGKTTLLNALAGRSGPAVVKGDIRVNGTPPQAGFYESIGFVEQLDMHDEKATVREALTFSALLRQPNHVARGERLADVDRILDLMNLRHLEDALVGTVNAGLGLEDRKRLSIAVELCARPSILFLDEPVSGLVSSSAVHIVQLMKKLSATGLAVIATVHQPSSELFDYFDNLLLLERGGTQIYFGPREKAVPYFEARSGTLCEAAANPAEFLIDTIACTREELKASAGSGRGAAGLRGMALRWHQSRERLNIIEEMDGRLSASTTHQSYVHGNRDAPLYTQCVELTKRLSRNFWRDAAFSYTKIITSIAVALIIGLSFFREPLTATGLHNRMFSVFLILFIPPVFMNQLIVKWFGVRGLWEGREKPARVYGNVALCTSFIAAELPYCLVSGAIFWAIWYFGVGFPLDADKMGFSFMMVQLFFVFQSYWAIWIAALAPTIGIVASMLPFALVSMEAFNGSLLPYSQIPKYWQWMYWVSPFQWYVKAMLSQLLHGLAVACTSEEVVVFEAPPGTSCEAYAGPFLRDEPGYLLLPGGAGRCGYCRFKSGDEFLATLSFGHAARWRAAGVFALYTLGNVLLAYFFVCEGRQKLAAGLTSLRRRFTRKGAIALE